MVQFKFAYDANVTVEQRVGFELAAAVWGHYLKDDITVNLRVGGRDNLNGGNATGGAVPILHRQNYGVLNEYYRQDAIASSGDESPSADEQALASLQTGNTVDIRVNGKVLNGNTEVVLTSAQAKALGMTEGINLDNGTHWNRDLVTSDALDGYVVINNDFDWNYDFTRSGEAAEGTLDFLSMAMHEIGHNLGFISGLDGTIDVETMLSGQTQISDFTMLDLFRHTVDTAGIENPDGSVSSLTIGENSYFSIDGGQTNLADFSTGQEGDGFQASHWKRFRQAIGIMDPTLAYQERASLSELDLQALDVLGWDVDYSQRGGIDLQTLLIQAESAVASSLGVEHSFLSNNRGANNLYNLGYSEWFSLFEGQISEIGVGAWWQIVEFGYGIWQDSDASGGSSWWDDFEAQMTETNGATWMQELEDELGYSDGGLWDAFEAQLAATGGATWMQMLEVGYSKWWQNLETYFSTLGEAGEVVENGEENIGQVVIDKGDSEQSVIVSGGDADDILAGSNYRDLISGGGGDDLIDGKDGDDSLLGEAGNDILYGWVGNDSLYGGSGDDLLSGEKGNDKLFGEAGHDILSGGFGHDLLEGEAGKDLLKGDAGNDVLAGGIGNDDISGGEGNDIAIGGRGEDSVSGGEGDDVIYGDLYRGVLEEEDVTYEDLYRDVLEEDKEARLEDISSQAEFATEIENISPIDFWVRLEAEDLTLKNFNVEDHAFSSGGSVAITGGRGEATTKFSGPTGIYDIVVGYHDEDENKHFGEITLEVGQGKKDGQKFGWDLDQSLKNEGTGIDNFTTYTLRGVEIESGERIELKGKSKGTEFVAFDYIDIISTTQSTALADAHFYDGSLYLLNETKTDKEAAALGGEYLGGVVKESAEEYWLKNVVGKTKEVTKVDVSSSEFSLLQDEATLTGKETIRLEAESFSLSGGYRVDERDDFTSGRAVIEVNSKYGGGQATTTFTGTSGLYDISVAYLDIKGEASASLSINGQSLSQWKFLSDEEDVEAEYHDVGYQVALNTGDTISIQGSADEKDAAIIDYVELIDVTNGKQESYQERLKLEAEDLLWQGKAKYKSDIDFASGERLVETEASRSSFIFSGESGFYSIALGYTDEGKGESSFSASVAGEQLGNWQLAGVKDAITAQTLVTEVFINKGDELDFQTGEKKLKVDYIDFQPSEDATDSSAGSADNAEGNAIGSAIVIQAEGMQLSGDYKDYEYDDFSGIHLKNESKSAGIASTLFMGETGYYDIIVGYNDLSGGKANLKIKLNEETLDNWLLDETLGAIGTINADNELTRTVASGIKLTRANDVLQIVGQANVEDSAFVDYIKLVQVEAPTASGGASKDLSTDSDVLRGGRGNDIVYGDVGNDRIYGEDEFDVGLLSASNSSDILVGGVGNDWLYGNSGNDVLYGDDEIDLSDWQFSNDTEPVKINPYNTSLGIEILLEAEDMDLFDGAKTKDESFASQGSFVELKDGQARTLFSGETGYYDIVVGYHDVEKGTAQLTAKLHEEELDKWQLNKSLGGKEDKANAYNADSRTVETQLFLTKDKDVVSLIGEKDQSDKGYIDYIKFIKVEAPERADAFTSNYFTTSEGDANDILEGGRGNDKLFGGAGDDILDGSDAIAKGAFEEDILGGGLGRDRFVLGNAEQSYYISDGDNDYAIIKDFDASSDMIQLHGSAGSYSHQQDGNHLRLLQGGELVAVLENTSELDFNGQSIDFV